MTTHGNDPAGTIERLCQAVGDRNVDAVVACFAADYRNETPAHPERNFTGRDQVRKNWTQIFAAVPDISAELLRVTVDGRTAWTEWEHRGTRPDGSPHLMRGVVIFGVEGAEIASARFYLEPVEQGGGGVDEAVRRQVRPEARA